MTIDFIRSRIQPMRVIVLAGLMLAGAARAESSTVHIGVSSNPCDGVPVQPTAAHKASGDWYDNWMKDWLALDWGQRCRYAPENSSLPPASSHRVVFIGDSITEMWKDADPQFFTHDVLDRGIGGQTSEQMLVRFRGDVIDLHPAVMHVMAGTNDIAGNRGPTSVSQIESNLQSMIEQAEAHHITVVIGSILPAGSFSWSPVKHAAETIKEVNAWLKAYADHHGLAYADYHSALTDAQGALRPEYSDDGVHPNPKGYAVMRPIAEKALAGR
jgi:lysophospholipase L1-like esterase